MHPQHFPTLSLIDRAVGWQPPRFADDPAAAYLEGRARELISEYWSDTAWLTGMVSEVSPRFVRERLELEQRALHDAHRLALATGSLIVVQVPEPGGVHASGKAELTLEIQTGVAS